jgi:hypothetical protein
MDVEDCETCRLLLRKYGRGHFVHWYCPFLEATGCLAVASGYDPLSSFAILPNLGGSYSFQFLLTFTCK